MTRAEYFGLKGPCLSPGHEQNVRNVVVHCPCALADLLWIADCKVLKLTDPQFRSFLPPKG